MVAITCPELVVSSRRVYQVDGDDVAEVLPSAGRTDGQPAIQPSGYGAMSPARAARFAAAAIHWLVDEGYIEFGDGVDGVLNSLVRVDATLKVID